MTQETKIFYSADDETYNCDSEYEAYEELAELVAPDELTTESCGYSMEFARHSPGDVLIKTHLVNDLIENLEENAADMCGGEEHTNMLTDLSKNDIEQLENLIADFLDSKTERKFDIWVPVYGSQVCYHPTQEDIDEIYA